MPTQNDALTSSHSSDIPSEITPINAEAHIAEDTALHQAARGAEVHRGGNNSRVIRRYDAEAVDYTSTSMDVDPKSLVDAECRPRTTILASTEEAQHSDSLEPLQYSSSSNTLYPPTDGESSPCRSAPTTPTVFTQPSISVLAEESGRGQNSFNQNASASSSSSGPGSPTPRIFKRAHRTNGSSFHSTESVISLKEADIPVYKLRPTLAKPRQRQRSNSVPPNVVLSPRSESLSVKRSLESSEEETMSKRSKQLHLTTDAKVSKNAATSQPLSQHQLYALHQLNLPRPAFLIDTFTASRTWSLRKGTSKSSSSVYGNAEITVPTLAPPITRHTLRELDLSEILRNPQLRHDIVFDSSLAFRPNVDGDRGVKKMLASERFWTAITREISFGCRCTAFEGTCSEPLRCVCSAVGFSQEVVRSLVDREAISTSGKVIFNAVPLATRLSSRIPPLVKELRSVLLSLLPANGNSPFDHIGPIEDQASRKVIQATLDPELIAQEVEHGVLDVASLGRFLGHTLKLHCAPMRDEMVDTMVACIESGDVDNGEVARGLRMAFEILELMKLDIANHQLRTLRPYLLDTAVDFELRSYLECADRRKARAMEKTLAWVSSTTARTGFKEPSDLIRDGLLELLFHPDIRPASPSRSKSRRSRHALSPSPSTIPETLQLDTHRLQTLHSDLTDLSVVYMLLMLFVQIVSPASLSTGQIEVVRREIWIIMHSNGIARSSGGLSPVTTSSLETLAPCPSTSHLSCAGWRKLLDERYKDSLQDVVLRLAVRAKMLQLGQVFTEDTPCALLPDPSTLDLMSRWLETHLKPNDSLYMLLQNRLRKTIDAMLASAMSKHSSSQKSWWVMSIAAEEQPLETSREPCSSISLRHFNPAAFNLGFTSKKRSRDTYEDDEEVSERRPRKKSRSLECEIDHEALIEALLSRNGLTPLRHECQVVAERIGRVATFHLDAYKTLYTCMVQQQQSH